MSKETNGKLCRGFKGKNHEAVVLRKKLHDPFRCVSLVHQTEATKISGWNPTLLDTALGIPPFPFIWVFLGFFAGDGDDLSTSMLWTDTNWVYQAAFQLIAGDSSGVCQMLQVTIALYGKRIPTSRAFAGINCQFAASEDLPLLWLLKGGTSIHFWCTVSSWEVWAGISTFPLLII